MLDSPVFIVGILFVRLLLCVVRKIRRGSFATVEQTFRGALAFLTLGSGVMVACVFLLTSPPAIELTSKEARWLAGLSTLIICTGVAWKEIRSIFFR